jgi:hypothetical protein
MLAYLDTAFHASNRNCSTVIAIKPKSKHISHVRRVVFAEDLYRKFPLNIYPPPITTRLSVL